MIYQKAFHTADISKSSFLITGGAGFIGSNVVEYLLNFGAGKVRVLDNLSTGFAENIEPFFQNPSFEFINGDIADIQTCHKACKGINFIIHQAALGSVPRSVKDPVATNLANVTGFINMLWAAQENGARRFVYASSSSVYGDSPHLPKVEHQMGNLLSPYAVSKRVDELYAAVFAHTYGMEILGLRYFNIFGPRQSPNGPYAAVIPLFMQAVLTNEDPYINGDGEQSRDFTFVENAVEANIKALFAPVHSCNGSVFNIAVGERTTINDLFFIIRDAAKSTSNPIYRNDREGDIKHSLADISKARELLGYNPAIGIKKGLEITFDWFKKKYITELKNQSNV
jgi:UDP-N-acetylglucosamine/UDP-N-acetylgalactosamine 4-epimerase